VCYRPFIEHNFISNYNYNYKYKYYIYIFVFVFNVNISFAKCFSNDWSAFVVKEGAKTYIDVDKEKDSTTIRNLQTNQIQVDGV
jgi:hypothetical protein